MEFVWHHSMQCPDHYTKVIDMHDKKVTLLSNTVHIGVIM